jgi:hypothetical protein
MNNKNVILGGLGIAVMGLAIFGLFNHHLTM